MKSIQFHGVTSVEVSTIGTYSRSTDGTPFYHRTLTITGSDGTKEELNLYCDNGYNLLVDDKELDSLQSDDLLKAA